MPFSCAVVRRSRTRSCLWTFQRCKSAIVIGNGLASAAVADSLRRRAWQVSVLAPRRLQQGSGLTLFNPVRMFKIQGVTQFTEASFEHLMKLLRSVQGASTAFSQCGILNVGRTADSRQPDSAWMAIPSERTSQLCGVALDMPTFYSHEAGWLNIYDLTAVLLKGCTVMPVAARELQYVDGLWRAIDDHKQIIAKADVVIVASGATGGLSQLDHLKMHLTTRRSQVSSVRTSNAMAGLRCILTFSKDEGYLLPARAGWHDVCATFDHGNVTREVNIADHVRNLSVAAQHVPAFIPALRQFQQHLLINSFEDVTAGSSPLQSVRGSVHFAVTSADRVPIVGAIPNHPGLYVSIGHGVHGACSAAYSGQLLAAIISQSDVDSSLTELVSPRRLGS
eukprot:TRINITY_DN2675_c0_g3_i1.p1 TRINITY_DN2675_c0_g3~~TRINITY_DN2675_c0_g3_i1.p1  ORF type:complete len:393 (+),score=51.51 TRINITY_DN2675_c0_g3_i1:120-1298(+)